MIYASPRFSEDLDFTGAGITVREIESVLEAALAQIEHEGIIVGIDEAKKTTGGYFEFSHYRAAETKVKFSLKRP